MKKIIKGDHLRGYLSGRAKGPKDRVSVREMAGNLMGGGENWKLPPGRETASLNSEFWEQPAKACTRERGCKVHLPHTQEPMKDLAEPAREDCPSPAAIPRALPWMGLELKGR